MIDNEFIAYALWTSLNTATGAMTKEKYLKGLKIRIRVKISIGKESTEFPSSRDSCHLETYVKEILKHWMRLEG